MLTIRNSIALMLATMLGMTQVQAADPDKPRLKFRGKGPACTCISSMGEAEIRKAMEARFAQSGNSRPETSDRDSTPSDEQRRELDVLQPR
jgi:hypothetical protein